MQNPHTDFSAIRSRMVERDIAGRGIHEPLVLAAMREVPRECFVPARFQGRAYDDAPLPIASGQTISQPYIVARMIAVVELQGGEQVLDVGTGSGYAAAVLSRIAGQVFTIERHGCLTDTAVHRFLELGYDNITARKGDGRFGWSRHAPYDAIVVGAAAREVPDALLKQLAVGGRLIIPTGSSTSQNLLRIERTEPDRYERRRLEAVRFVPLV